jgi:hypothetical protein
MNWQLHYCLDGAHYDPVDKAEFIRLIQSGDVPPGTQV